MTKKPSHSTRAIDSARPHSPEPRRPGSSEEASHRFPEAQKLSATETPQPEARFLEELMRGQRLIVAGHLNPDGDSVGSSVALAHALKNMGRQMTVSLTESSPAISSF